MGMNDAFQCNFVKKIFCEKNFNCTQYKLVLVREKKISIAF